MFLVILNMLVDALIAAMAFYAFKKQDDKIFFVAWALYGFMDLYWSLPSVVLYYCYSVPYYANGIIEGEHIMAAAAYCDLLVGSILIVVSYFLYHKQRWAYYVVRILCYIKAFGFLIIYPICFITMMYMFFAKNTTFPYSQQLLLCGNYAIGICFLIYSFKCLDMIKSKLREKRSRIKTYERENIECPECGNIILSNEDFCVKCSWSYKTHE